MAKKCEIFRVLFKRMLNNLVNFADVFLIYCGNWKFHGQQIQLKAKNRILLNIEWYKSTWPTSLIHLNERTRFFNALKTFIFTDGVGI